MWVMAVLLWDVVDYFLFLWWYLDSKPARNQTAQFEEDFVVAYICCGVLWVGPCLPMTACLLNRKHYSILQFLYDGLEVYLVWYTDIRFGFKTVGAWATQANYWSTIIDGVVFESPTFWYKFCCADDEDSFEKMDDTELAPE